MTTADVQDCLVANNRIAAECNVERYYRHKRITVQDAINVNLAEELGISGGGQISRHEPELFDKLMKQGEEREV